MIANRRRFRRAVAAVAVAGAATTALSGCGVSDEALRPGVAAQLGSTSIGLDEVDDSAGDLCDMIDVLVDKGTQGVIPLPGSLVRDNSLQYEVLRELADQLANEYGVEPSDSYRDSLKQTESQLAGLGVSGDLLDDVVPHISSGDYFIDIVRQIGERELAGSDDDSDEAVVGEGLRIAQEWENEVGLDINPRFSDMHIGDVEQYVRTNTEDLSIAVGDFATDAAAAAEPGNTDPAFAESLPESQRCG